MSETTQQVSETTQELEKIAKMSHFDMCALWRRAPAGHPYFDARLPYHQAFRDRLFGEFGGFTPEISKAIGWE